MAERRMFAKSIIDSDAFLDMPISARLLYYDLAMRADDDGFNNSPKKIMKIIGASEDDLRILAARKFIIPFENGVVVIKHWRIHNYIRKDTYKETNYKEEKEMLFLDENNAYSLSETHSLQSRDEPVDEPLTQVRLGKDSIGKDSIGNIIAPPDEEKIFIELILNDKSYFEVSYDLVNEYQELYPAVDVKQQLRNMKGWCDANPTNRKTRTGIKRFINSWLSKEQNRGGNYRPEQEKKTGKNFDANKGLMKHGYNFDELEAEIKNRTEVKAQTIKEPEKKQLSKLQNKLLSLPINKDFRFAYLGKEFWGTRYENSVAIMLKGGDFEQYSIDKLEDHLSELPDYKEG